VFIDTPRDRNRNFKHQPLPKRQSYLGEVLDSKVISFYARAMSSSDICTYLEEMYGLTVCPTTLSSITDRILDHAKQWLRSPLESVYPLVRLDAIHFKVRDKGAILSKAVY
jgi:putative transposase